MTSPESEPAEPKDDTQEKFREALERKRHQHNEQNPEGSTKGSGKVRAKREPVTRRRTFRRKSG